MCYDVGSIGASGIRAELETLKVKISTAIFPHFLCSRDLTFLRLCPAS